MPIYRNVDEWLDEIEAFSARRERFGEAVLSCSEEKMTEWLKMAWALGKESAEMCAEE